MSDVILSSLLSAVQLLAGLIGTDVLAQVLGKLTTPTSGKILCCEMIPESKAIQYQSLQHFRLLF